MQMDFDNILDVELEIATARFQRADWTIVCRVPEIEAFYWLLKAYIRLLEGYLEQVVIPRSAIDPRYLARTLYAHFCDELPKLHDGKPDVFRALEATSRKMGLPIYAVVRLAGVGQADYENIPA